MPRPVEYVRARLAQAPPWEVRRARSEGSLRSRSMALTRASSIRVNGWPRNEYSNNFKDAKNMNPATAAGSTFDLGHLLGDLLPTLGVGGAIAALVFWFYQKREKEVMRTLEQMSNRWEHAAEGWVKIVHDNTEAITKLLERLK